MTTDFWLGKSVLVTGHTGFKGSWLALWLHDLGARVAGYALPPPSSPSLHDLARMADLVDGVEGDVRDLDRLREVFAARKPEIVFHLAAQSLVRPSYEEPVATFDTNVMGAINVLEACRYARSVRAVVMVTSDKCYENREWHWAYREDDALGGHDPYSASKACAELVTASYRRAFLNDHGPRVASVRAGNVIGGGDWARDRLVPDLVTALAAKRPAIIRNPASIRPWQHVAEPLGGYLLVAQRLYEGSSDAASAWNFGPHPESVQPVSVIADRVCELWGDGATWRRDESQQPHEARTLTLDSAKARAALGWRPRLGHDVTLEWTVDWYKTAARGSGAREKTLTQIRRYRELAS
jgi:CDP-glucose 4,6-dehydratase